MAVPGFLPLTSIQQALGGVEGPRLFSLPATVCISPTRFSSMWTTELLCQMLQGFFTVWLCKSSSHVFKILKSFVLNTLNDYSQNDAAT